MSLKYRDPETGAWVSVGTIQGPKGDPGETPQNALLYDKQDLTEEQKAQARENIGASAEAVLYDTLYSALTDIKNDTRENAIFDTSAAKVKIVTSNSGKLTVTLLDDVELSANFSSTKDFDLNLNGFTLNLVNGAILNLHGKSSVYGGINPVSGNRGSITKSGTTANSTVMVQTKSSEFVCKGVDFSIVEDVTKSSYGLYILKDCKKAIIEDCNIYVESKSTVSGGSSKGLNISSSDTNTPDVVIKNCNIQVKTICGDAAGFSTSAKTIVDGVDISVNVVQDGNAFAGYVYERGILEVKDSRFVGVYEGNVNGKAAHGVCNLGILRAKNSTFYADARGGNTSQPYSIGVVNNGTSYLDDCVVTGTHSGMQLSDGSSYINGGTYTGNWHGGLYSSQPQDCIAYVNNAHFRDCVYEGQFPDTNEINAANCWGAVYIGGNPDANNITIHMDGCTFEGYKHAICMRGSMGEQNNTVNLSNCTFMPRKYSEELCTINYHNNSHHVNVGVGCNITTEQIFTDGSFDIVNAMMVFTNESYHKVAPDKILTGRDFYALTSEIDRKVNETLPIEAYFDIDDDGMISLKPEYRGHCSKSEYHYGVSDNGIKVNGSKNSELPEHIIIPEIINEIAVTALAKGMFAWNDAVKTITIPACIIEIPEAFCYGSLGIKEVKGTENVKVLGGSAFRQTTLEKANFPALERLDGTHHFSNAVLLTIADLGSEITALPQDIFAYAEHLSCLRNAENVTSVGERAFYRTRRLMNPAFLPKLTSIGKEAFSISRVNYDWASLTNCSFGELATSLQLNTTDYSGCTYTPCKMPVRSTFNQRNPEWADLEIGSTGRTYSAGCVITSAATIYSALMGVDLASPVEYAELVRAVNPDLLTISSANFENQKQYLEAVGLSAEYREGLTPENVQVIYDALASGAYILAGVEPAHAVVFHGINSKGELLVVDSECMTYRLGVYKAMTYPVLLQNVTEPTEHFLIVTKS